VDHGAFEDLVEGVFILELGVGVVLAVGMVYTGDFSEVVNLRTVPITHVSTRCSVQRFGLGRNSLLHMFPTRISKQLRRTGCLRNTTRLFQHQMCGSRRILPVLEETLQTARKHLLKTDNQYTVTGSMRNHVPSHVQTRAPGRAVVVHIIYGDTGHAELVEDALAACGVSVAVASDTLLDVVVVDVGVEHGFYTSFEAEFRVVYFAARFYEFGHSHAKYVDGLLLGDHDGGCWDWLGEESMMVMAEISLYEVVLKKKSSEAQGRSEMGSHCGIPRVDKHLTTPHAGMRRGTADAEVRFVWLESVRTSYPLPKHLGNRMHLILALNI
jgi:hypothetical protein